MRTLSSFKFSSLKHFSVSVATGLVLLYAHSAYADTKIADTTANLGSTTAARTPDGVLEVVGGTLGSKPTLVVRGADSAASSGTTTGGTTPSMVVTQDGKVGVGTASPVGAMEITSTTGGFVPPRMTTAQQTALVTPATGTTIYNTTTGEMQVNTGTPAAPVWSTLITSAPNAGVTANKIIYAAAATDPTKTVVSGRFEYRLNAAVPQFRLVAAPAANVTVNYHNMQTWTNNNYTFQQFSKTFTPANFSTWVDCAYNTTDGITTSEQNEVFMVYPGDNNIYKIRFLGINAGAVTNWGILVERY